MKRPLQKTQGPLAKKLEIVQKRLKEARGALQAIRKGDTDTLIVPTPQGPKVYALQNPTHDYQVMIESMNEGALTLEPDGEILYANPCFSAMVGVDASNLAGHRIQLFADSISNGKVLTTFLSRGIRSAQKANFIFRRSDASIFPVSLSVNPLTFMGKPMICMIVTDLTENKRRETQLLEEQERYHNLFENVPQPLIVYEVDTFTILTVNEAALKLYGYTRDEFRSMTLMNLRAPEDLPQFMKMIPDFKTGSEIKAYFRHRMKDGRVLDVEVISHPITMEGQRIRLSVIMDVTERLKAQRDLAESEARFRQIAENIQQIFWLSDAALHDMIYISPSFEKIWGRSCDSLYKNPSSFIDAVHPDDRARVLKELEKFSEGIQQEFRIVQPGGAVRHIFARGFPIKDSEGKTYRVAGLAEDVTEQKLLKEQYVHAQKMESIGILAGGVAHDFNNILTVIKAYLNLLLPQFPEQTQTRKDIQEIKSAADQATSLTRQLLTFSRKQMLQPRIVQLNDVVKAIEPLIRRLIGEDIVLDVTLDASLPNMKIDPAQVDQILMNLAANARDAMPNGGRLTIETARGPGSGAQADLGVVLTVRDTGSGMNETTKAHLFEPFYTTKGEGQGTGLGLATVYGIVQQSAGTVQVESELGKGTVFRLFFPIAMESVAAPVRGAPMTSSGGKGETILVVEDEPSIRAVLLRVLTQKGYRVLEAGHGEEALAVCQHTSDRIELVVTDMIMPQMGGREFTQTLRKTFPELKILYMSGYTDRAIIDKGLMEEGVSFIQKPFELDDVAVKIRHLLDQSKSVP